MCEFNSDDHYIYYCGQGSLRRNGVAIIVNKRIQNAVLGCNLKNDRMISVRFQGKPFNITVIQLYAPTRNAEEAEIEWFYGEGNGTPLQYSCLENPMDGGTWKAAAHGIAEGRTRLSNFTFIIGDWNAEAGSQKTPGVTGKFDLGIQNDAGQWLIDFCQENALVIANTLSNNTREDSTHDITRWSTPKSN